MGFFSDNSDQAQAYDQIQNADPSNEEHKAALSHEVLAGGAAYEAMKAYENHCANNGKPDSHARAKEILAGAIGAFVDREVETKGLDFIDRRFPMYRCGLCLRELLSLIYISGERAKRQATEQAESGLIGAGEY